MAQTFALLPSKHYQQRLSSYINATSQPQIARITNISNWYFERVVFPGERLLFKAPPAAQLEIHTCTIASAILSDKIPCDCLRVSEGMNASHEATDELEGF